ncbi:MAG: hypothetical protein BWY75_03321 [bacterium ADurb.Bin425]|nr:MAG: hypothetical protein BWY75_03321 [bacterium ADurb.Bin425]
MNASSIAPSNALSELATYFTASSKEVIKPCFSRLATAPDLAKTDLSGARFIEVPSKYKPSILLNSACSLVTSEEAFFIELSIAAI